LCAKEYIANDFNPRNDVWKLYAMIA
jgi:hypothetical protein